jgi:hypothetical protein
MGKSYQRRCEGDGNVGSLQQVCRYIFSFFRELELHFTVLYMVFVGNFRSGFCWYICIWLLLEILDLVFVIVGIFVYVFC